MRQTNIDELNRLFTQDITVAYIAEDLISCGDDEEIARARELMNKHEFDVLGVDRDGVVCGYVRREDLGPGTETCAQHKVDFQIGDLVAHSTPLLDAFRLMRDKPQLFVLTADRVDRIVTKGDLGKAPVRMMIFGLITTLEMHLLRLIREFYPGGGWHTKIRPNRLKAARKLQDDRALVNEQLDLADCLQFCDKADIIWGTPKVRKRLPVPQAFFDQAMQLRDRLAHANSLVRETDDWNLVDLVESTERVIRACEEVPFPGTVHVGRIQEKRRAVPGFVGVTLADECDQALMYVDMPGSLWARVEERFGKEEWRGQAIYWWFEPEYKMYMGGFEAFADARQALHDQWKRNADSEMFRLFGVPVEDDEQA